MYRTLTSLSVRVTHNFASTVSHKLTFKSTRALFTPHLQRPSSWHAHTRWYSSQLSAATASSTESLPGVAAKMLLGKADAYEGFIVSADALPTSPEEFHSQLEQSLQVRGCTGHTIITLCCAMHHATILLWFRIGRRLERKASGSLCQQQSRS